jgi:hypothetical protein
MPSGPFESATELADQPRGREARENGQQGFVHYCPFRTDGTLPPNLVNSHKPAATRRLLTTKPLPSPSATI